MRQINIPVSAGHLQEGAGDVCWGRLDNVVIVAVDVDVRLLWVAGRG